MDTSRSPECRAQLALSAMTPEERIAFRGTNDRLGLASPAGNDGPNGLRGGTHVTAFPNAINLGATWDRDLARRFGEAIGEEFHGKGMTFVVGPTINLLRTWHWGRNAESFSEDPYHMSEVAVPEILGIQSRKVIAVSKHFAGNNTEDTRTGVFPDYAGIDERITEKALFEIYFPHFKAAVARAHTGGIMCAYNQVNGSFSCNDKWMLDQLRNWGFDGFIIPDARFALRSVEAAAPAGVDNVSGTELNELVKVGKLPASLIDSIAMHYLVPRFRLGIYDDGTRGNANTNVSTPEHVRLAAEVAASSAVLLRNQHAVLPLTAPLVKSIAVIGPDAGPAVTVMMGGSARVTVDPALLKTPLDSIKARAGSTVAVTYAPGTRGIGALTALPASVLRTASGAPGLDGAYWKNALFTGAPALLRVDSSADFVAPSPDVVTAAPPAPAPGAGGPPQGQGGGGNAPHQSWSAKWKGTLIPPSTGLYRFSISSGGTAQLYIANRAVISMMHVDGSMVAHGTIELTAGQPVPIELQFQNDSSRSTNPQVNVGWAPPEPELIRDAVAAAKRSTVAVVFAAELMGEGYDKMTLGLPGDQDRLIEAVAEANPRTIVVLHTSNPVAMPWIDKVAAVVEAWYPGQEAGSSIASVLFGDVNPSGKLPMTFPANEMQGPATRWTEYPGDGHSANFTEGVLVGYRWYDAMNQQPLFGFGHGLSYTAFKYDGIQVKSNADSATVKVRVTNIGKRAGAEVAQLYLESPPQALEPPRQLKGFEKTMLQPGESSTLTFTLDRDALSSWDEYSHEWKLYPGNYTVNVGSSSRDLRVKTGFNISAR
jgi:beta-glucosidase